MILDLTVPGNILGIFEELAPLSRHDAEWLARRLDSWDRKGQADDLSNGLVCIIPTRRLAEELAPYLHSHETVVEVCAGHGWLRRTFIDAGLLGDCAYHATDKLIDHNGVERLDQWEAVHRYEPTLVICSWPPPRPEVASWLTEWDELGVRSVLAIGPWPAEQPRVGRLLDGFPADWRGMDIPSASREVVDVFGNVSRVYILNKGLINVKDED